MTLFIPSLYLIYADKYSSSIRSSSGITRAKSSGYNMRALIRFFTSAMASSINCTVLDSEMQLGSQIILALSIFFSASLKLKPQETLSATKRGNRVA